MNLEAWERLLAAIRALPAPQQQQMQMHLVDGLTPDQIARATGLPLHEVRRLMETALNELRPYMEG